MSDRTVEKPSTGGSARRPAKQTGAAKSGKTAKGSGKPSLGDRARSTIKRAADEHNANAQAKPRQGSPVRPSPASGRRAPRRARLRLTRVDPWSVMKTSFLLSIAFGIVLVVSVFMVWSVLSAAGVWESINSTVDSVLGGDAASSFDVENYVGTSRVLGFTLLLAALDVILLTAIATLGAFLYNLSAALLGGVEVTLAEDMH
jgi:hypothetical protein